MTENENKTKIRINDQSGGSIEVETSKEDAEKLKETFSAIQQVQAANRQLTDEKAQLEADLIIIAEKELNAKVKKYGIDPDLPEETKILKVKRAEEQEIQQAPTGTASLNEYQTGQRDYDRDARAKQALSQEAKDESFDSVEDMFLEIQRKAKNAQDPAIQAEYQAVEKEFAKKALKKPLNIELESNMRTIARKPKMVVDRNGNPIEDPDQYQNRLDNWKKSQKWKNLKEDE